MLIKTRPDTAKPHLREGSTTGESGEVDAVKKPCFINDQKCALDCCLLK